MSAKRMNYLIIIIWEDFFGSVHDALPLLFRGKEEVNING